MKKFNIYYMSILILLHFTSCLNQSKKNISDQLKSQLKKEFNCADDKLDSLEKISDDKFIKTSNKDICNQLGIKNNFLNKVAINRIKKINILDSIIEKFAIVDPYKRPDDLQKEIDETFEGLSSLRDANFSYYGTTACNNPINDIKKIFRYTIKNAIENNQKTLFIMDIGCGAADWGNHIMKKLSENQFGDISKFEEIHILSVTAEDIDTKVIKSKNIKHHIIGKFKCEDFTKSIKKLKIDTKNKNWYNEIDFISSQMTFIHLHDPLGTVLQLLNHLNKDGIFNCDGFQILYENKLYQAIIILKYIQNCKFLATCSSNGSRCNSFLLQKLKNPCRIFGSYNSSSSGCCFYNKHATSKELANFKLFSNALSFTRTNKHIFGDEDLFQEMSLKQDQYQEKEWTRAYKHLDKEKNFDSFKTDLPEISNTIKLFKENKAKIKSFKIKFSNFIQENKNITAFEFNNLLEEFFYPILYWFKKKNIDKKLLKNNKFLEHLVKDNNIIGRKYNKTEDLVNEYLEEKGNEKMLIEWIEESINNLESILEKKTLDFIKININLKGNI